MSDPIDTTVEPRELDSRIDAAITLFGCMKCHVVTPVLVNGYKRMWACVECRELFYPNGVEVSAAEKARMRKNQLERWQNA